MAISDRNRIVSVVTFNVTPDTFGPVYREAGLLMERRLPTIPGFIEGMLLANETKTRIIAMSEWTSRYSWAVAQSDEDVARTLADIFLGTASYSLEFYRPLVVVHAPQ